MMRYGSGLRTVTQTEFGGYTHTAGARDGDIYDMRNLTAAHAPVLASREPRTLFATLAGTPNGIFAKDGLLWVDGTEVYYKGEPVGEVSDSLKTFGELGAYVVILPDKKYLNILTGEFGDLESSITTGTYWVTFTNGTYKGEAAEANTLYSAQVDFNALFKPLDAVTVSGCTVHPENNKTVIVREISEDGHSLIFYEYTFILDGDPPTTPYVEPGALVIARTMPDLDFICSSENRLWGARGDEIFGSALGDPFNWNVFDTSDIYGTVADSSFNAVVGSGEDFSAMFAYMGYPIAVKPSTGIYKVFGTEPDNFQISGSASVGVAYGSSRSVAVAGDICFYLSNAGVMAYTGGVPAPRYEAFGGERYTDGVAGSDQRRYYISMKNGAGVYSLFVYDTEKRMWHREDETRAVGFAFDGGALYMLTDGGEILIVSGDAADGQGVGAGLKPARFGEYESTGNRAGLKPAAPPVPGGRVIKTRGGAGNAASAATRAGLKPAPTDGGGTSEPEGPVSWMCEFADIAEDIHVKKGVTKLYARIELDEGASCVMWIRYDSAGEWRVVNEYFADVKRSYVIPVIPRRADHYRIRLTGYGGFKLYSLTREFYSGSALRSLPGRQ
jgi:hypothetical protein